MTALAKFGFGNLWELFLSDDPSLVEIFKRKDMFGMVEYCIYFLYYLHFLSELFNNISTVKTLDQILEPVKLLLDEEDGGTSSYKIRFNESQLYPIPYFPGHKFEIDLRPYSNKFK